MVFDQVEKTKQIHKPKLNKENKLTLKLEEQGNQTEYLIEYLAGTRKVISMKYQFKGIIQFCKYFILSNKYY